MTIEAQLLGVKCNLACTYCYQNPLRDAGAAAPGLDLAAVKESLASEMAAAATVSDPRPSFTVFGGDPLLVPLPTLRDLWSFGLERSGRNGVQTNGALITDEHMEAFKRYNVHVGFSVDGPGELNRARWAGTVARTDAATEASNAAIRRCLAEGVGASLIVTLHRLNASPDRLPRLLDWLRELGAAGLRHARAHVLESDGRQGEALRLTEEENVAALRAVARVGAEANIKFDVFDDMLKLLRGTDDSVTCVWNACDPWTTPAVRNVAADGSRTNCSRTNKDGVDWQKSAKTTYARQLALAATPQENNGCAGCRFFVMCKGQCPGTAIDGDPRNRSRDCRTWFALFEHLEGQLMDMGERPVSRRPDLARVEEAMLASFAAGKFMSVREAVAAAAVPEGCVPVPGGWHGDHTDHGRTR